MINSLAVIENFNYNIQYVQTTLGDSPIPTEQNIIKIAPKKNTLLKVFKQWDIDCRFKPYSTYKYKKYSIGKAFINEWHDSIKTYNKNCNSSNYPLLNWKDRQIKTNPRIVFIRNIYYVDIIQYVEINHIIMNFFHKVKQYYKNKVNQKKSPKFLLYRQIYGHFPKKI